MSRYYHNENPQVELWKEQARRVQELMIDYKAKIDLYKAVAEDLSKDIKELNNQARVFNSLPWYKKVFYKFDI